MNCQHSNIRIMLTPNLPHHAREDCADCGRFLRWLPEPETVEREKENARKIAVLKSKALDEWEKGFLLSLEKQGRHFSPKQQAKLDEVFLRYAPGFHHS